MYQIASSNMYVCQICGKYASPQFDSVLRHIGAVHFKEAGFNVFCGIEMCPSSFKNYHAWRRHIREKHPFMLSRPTSSALTPEVTAADDQQQPENSEEEQLDLDQLVTAAVDQHCEPEYMDVDEEDIHKRAEALHILKFKERYKLSQTTVDDIIGDVGEITAGIVSKLHKRVTDLLAEKQIDVEIDDVFTDENLTPFRDLKTEHRQNQYFLNHLGLVVSETISVD